MWRYVSARVYRRPLVWLKTEHAYPSRETLQPHRRELADVLVTSGYISQELLSAVQAEMPRDADLADFLSTNRIVSEEDLCQAMSLQSGLPSARVDVRRVKPRVLRSLPAHVEERFGIVPFRVHAGRLLVAGTRVPPSSVFEELRSFTRLPVDFQLVTKGNYDELRDML